MAKPYSQDLRDRVIGAVDSGISARAASRLFGISESTGIKWGSRWRHTGSIGAKRMGGSDLNPIEMAFAKLKAGPRKAGERSVDQLWDRIGSLLETFTQQECANYFRHAGYA